jgi:HTH-type transcriptional regulator / antitoxin HigA
MKTTLIVIQNEADHADAKKLIEKLMRSSDSQDRARMVAQARLVEAYERTQWPPTAPSLPVLLAYLMINITFRAPISYRYLEQPAA